MSEHLGGGETVQTVPLLEFILTSERLDSPASHPVMCVR